MRLPPGAIICLFLAFLFSACCSSREPARASSGELRCPRHKVAMTVHQAYRTDAGACVLYSPAYERLRKRNPYTKPESLLISLVRSKEYPVPTTYSLCPVCQANVDAWEASQARKSPTPRP